MRQRLEYKIVTKPVGESLHEKELNALGEAGWGLITVVQRSEPEGTVEVDGFPQQVKIPVLDFILCRFSGMAMPLFSSKEVQ